LKNVTPLNCSVDIDIKNSNNVSLFVLHSLAFIFVAFCSVQGIIRAERDRLSLTLDWQPRSPSPAALYNE